RGSRRTVEEIGLRAEAEPHLVGVGLASCAGRVASIVVLGVQLRVRGEDTAVIRVEANLRHAQLPVTSGIDRRFEPDRLSHREEARRKRKTQRKGRFFTVAIVCAQLETRSKTPAFALREERKR